ncbi:MAG: M90 family metallopeptidase [Planctomycetota bacterium]|nr:M90 family metallopeptidase [Planctomycetota bacterium]MDA1114095.1 M90 family metallopeptidase [Planctomycetota bacterium]
MFAWLRRRRRVRLGKQGLPADLVQWLEVLPFIDHLNSEERKRLEALVCVFLAEKNFEGCNGLEMRDKIRVVIAAQACLLILNLDHVFYQKVKTILVYPSTFRHRSQQTTAGGVVENREHTNLGEAWPNGPIVLAWDHAYQGGRNPDDGQNTVFHEFAHKLDMLDGITDGIPPLTLAHEEDAWRMRMDAAALRHKEMAQRGVPLFLDKYGATHPAEFFAVATEMFFERPRDLQKREAEVYDLLMTFYRQDPAASKS